MGWGRGRVWVGSTCVASGVAIGFCHSLRRTSASLGHFHGLSELQDSFSVTYLILREKPTIGLLTSTWASTCHGRLSHKGPP